MSGIPTIILFGATGAGKSSFIARAFGPQARVAVGHGLKSCTQDISAVAGEIGGVKCVLVDTPGFDDSERNETELLRSLCDWLAEAKRGGTKFCGILYLHRITDPRVGGIAQKNMRLFRSICGDSVMSKVILCTTHWDEVATTVGERREAELRDNFWKDMVTQGSTLARHDNSPASAQRIASRVFKDTGVDLKVQQEMVGEGRSFATTSAAAALGAEIARLAAEHEAARLRVERETREAYEQEQARLRARIDEERRQQEKLERERRELQAAEERRQAEIRAQEELQRQQRLRQEQQEREIRELRAAQERERAETAARLEAQRLIQEQHEREIREANERARRHPPVEVRVAREVKRAFRKFRF